MLEPLNANQTVILFLYMNEVVKTKELIWMTYVNVYESKQVTKCFYNRMRISRTALHSLSVIVYRNEESCVEIHREQSPETYPSSE